MLRAGRHFCEHLIPLPCFQVWTETDANRIILNPTASDYVSVEEAEFNERHEDERHVF